MAVLEPRPVAGVEERLDEAHAGEPEAAALHRALGGEPGPMVGQGPPAHPLVRSPAWPPCCPTCHRSSGTPSVPGGVM